MTTAAIAAGWYPDPLAPAVALRYWDGNGWAEQTAPITSVPQQQSPAHPEPQQSQPQQQVPQQQVPQQQMPQQQFEQPFGPQPGYLPRGQQLSPAYQQSPRSVPNWYRAAPSRRSTGSIVLICIAIALAAFVGVAVLFAIAIPVFLNQRATAAATTVDLPDTAVGLVRLDPAASREQIRLALALPLPGTRSAAAYGSTAGQERAFILVGSFAMTPTEQSDFLRGARDGGSQSGVTSMHSVDPGRLGGTMTCGVLTGRQVTGCLFADSGAYGIIDVFGTTSGDQLAVRLREAVEHKK